MTKEQFDMAFRGFCRRRPFRKFLIEFTSGPQLAISHPEAIRDEDQLYVMRHPNREHVVFTAESVVRLLDMPSGTAS